MNWNIENLSSNKVGIIGMKENFRKVIATAYNRAAGTFGAGVALLLVVNRTNTTVIMTAVSAASVARGGNANDNTGWLALYNTGGERYGCSSRTSTQCVPSTSRQAPPMPTAVAITICFP